MRWLLLLLLTACQPATAAYTGYGAKAGGFRGAAGGGGGGPSVCNPATDIASVGGFYVADAGIFTDVGCATPASGTDPVRCWEDQSTAGAADATEATTNPTISVSTLNSQGLLNFPGGNRLTFTGSNLAQPYSVWVAFVGNSGTGDRFFWDIQSSCGNTARSAAFWQSANVYLATFAGAQITSTTARPSSGGHTVLSVHDGASSAMYLDNASIVTGNVSTRVFPLGVSVQLAASCTAVAGNGFNGDIAAFGWFSTSLSAGDRTCLSDYAADKWGI